MHKNIRRALAIAAVAPLSIIGMAGPAGAATGDPSDFTSNGVGNLQTATCYHPDFDGPAPDADELGFKLEVRLEGTGSGRDHDDIEWVKITATDNQGTVSWKDSDAHVDKIRVSYFSEDDITLTGIFGGIKPIYSKTYGDSGARDGRQTFVGEKDNVGYIEVKVSWSEAGDPPDAETLLCGFQVSQFNVSL